MSIHVTNHACERFVERVQACTIAEARASILASSKALEAAAAFGCEVVRRATGERLILNGRTVVTVFPAGDLPRQCRCSHLHPLGQVEPL